MYLTYFLVTYIACGYIYVEPLKTLRGQEVTTALDNILTKTKIERLRTDKGSEFLNAHVRKLLNDRLVQHFTTTNETKANYAERAIKTIKFKIAHYFSEN
jgi:transposase InsO family protein